MHNYPFDPFEMQDRHHAQMFKFYYYTAVIGLLDIENMTFATKFELHVPYTQINSPK